MSNRVQITGDKNFGQRALSDSLGAISFTDMAFPTANEEGRLRIELSDYLIASIVHGLLRR